jgi:hypothetical protein
LHVKGTADSEDYHKEMLVGKHSVIHYLETTFTFGWFEKPKKESNFNENPLKNPAYRNKSVLRRLQIVEQESDDQDYSLERFIWQEHDG